MPRSVCWSSSVAAFSTYAKNAGGRQPQGHSLHHIYFFAGHLLGWWHAVYIEVWWWGKSNDRISFLQKALSGFTQSADGTFRSLKLVGPIDITLADIDCFSLPTKPELVTQHQYFKDWLACY